MTKPPFQTRAPGTSRQRAAEQRVGQTLFLLLILAGSWGVAEENRSVSIASYVGKDVREMKPGEREAFVSAFRSVTKDDSALSTEEWRFVPQKLYAFANPEFRFFVEIAPGFERPGFCGLRLHIFDDTWKFVRKGVFSTGYRQEVTDVYQTRPKMLGTDVLVIKTKSAGPWEVTEKGERIGTPFFAGKHQLQFYAVVDGRLMLVRREDERGRLLLNNYANWSVPEIGSHYPKGPLQKSLEILRSEHLPAQIGIARVGFGHAHEL